MARGRQRPHGFFAGRKPYKMSAIREGNGDAARYSMEFRLRARGSAKMRSTVWALFGLPVGILGGALFHLEVVPGYSALGRPLEVVGFLMVGAAVALRYEGESERWLILALFLSPLWSFWPRKAEEDDGA